MALFFVWSTGLNLAEFKMITHLSLSFTAFDLFHELSTGFPEVPIFRQKWPDPEFHYSPGDGHRIVLSILLSKPSICYWPRPESSWCLGMGPFLENQSYKAEWNPRLVLSLFILQREKVKARGLETSSRLWLRGAALGWKHQVSSTQARASSLHCALP